MPNSLSMNVRLFLILAVTAVLVGFGVFVLVPVASKNIFFVFSIPFACFFVVIMAVRPKWALVSLLTVRSLLDLLLEHTKVELSSSSGAGIGGILNLLIIGLAILVIYQNLGNLSKIIPFLWFWALFLAVCAISIVFSPDAVITSKALVQQTVCLVIFLTPFFIVKNENDKKFWLKVLIFSSLLPVGLADFGLVSRSRALYLSTVDAGLRLQGSFTHPNILAFYIVLIIVISFYVMKTRCIVLSSVQKNLIRLYILNLMVILVATKTRSALLACWLVFFLYGLVKERRYLVVVLLLSSLLFLAPQVQERMSGLFSKAPSRAELGKNSFDWRMKLWISSLPSIQRRPVFGHGLASFRVLSPTFFNVGHAGTLAHNVYIELLFETGLMGLIGYLGIFLHLLKTFYSKVRDKTSEWSRESAVVFAFLIGHLTVCFSDNILDYVAYNWYFFYFLGLAASSLLLSPKEATENP